MCETSGGGSGGGRIYLACFIFSTTGLYSNPENFTTTIAKSILIKREKSIECANALYVEGHTLGMPIIWQRFPNIVTEQEYGEV